MSWINECIILNDLFWITSHWAKWSDLNPKRASELRVIYKIVRYHDLSWLFKVHVIQSTAYRQIGIIEMVWIMADNSAYYLALELETLNSSSFCVNHVTSRRIHKQAIWSKLDTLTSYKAVSNLWKEKLFSCELQGEGKKGSTVDVFSVEIAVWQHWM